MKRITALDGLRGLAILLVVMFHYSFGGHEANKALRVYSFLAEQGWTGVTLFFILSGFLITGILWDSRGQEGYIKSFYVRRTCRIFPLYYLALVLVLISAAIIHRFSIAAGRIIYPALFLQDFPGAPTFAINAPESPLSLFHFWSLAVEEHFYLVWPFVLCLPKTTTSAMRMTLGVLIFCEVCFFGTNYIPFLARHLPLVLSRGGEIALGGALALLFRSEHRNILDRWAGPSCATGLAGYLILTVINSPVRFVIGIPCITICYASLLILCLRNEHVARIMEAKWLVFLGRISYGLYVYHVLLGGVFQLLAHAIVGSNHRSLYESLDRVLSLSLTILISWVSFTYFESFFIALGHRYKRRRTQASPYIDDATRSSRMEAALDVSVLGVSSGRPKS